MTWPTIVLRRLVTCLDGRRVPLNSGQRAEMKGNIPYWGAGGVLDFVNRAIFDEPLVLLKEDGSPFFIPGKGVAYYVEGPTWINNHIHALRAIGVDGRFLAYALNCVDYSKYLTGSTRDKLTQEDLKRIDVWYPPLVEQRRIADFLDAETARISQLVELRERQRQLLQSRQEESVRHLFGEVQTYRTRLKFLLADRPRYGVLVPKFEDGGVKFIRVNDLVDLPGRAEGLATIAPDTSAQYPTTVVRAYDVLVSVVGTLGRAAVAPPSVAGANVNRAIAVLRPSPRVDRQLLATWINSSDFQEQALLATGNDSAQRTLGMEDMSNFSLKWPTDEDGQKRLARMVARCTELTRRLENKLQQQTAVLAERRQALITAAVTGQFDVSTASGRNVTEGLLA